MKDLNQNYYCWNSSFFNLRSFSDFFFFNSSLRFSIMMPLPKLTDKLERIIYYKPLSKPDFKAEYNFCLILFIELLKVYDNSLAYIYLVDYQDATFDLIKKMDLPFVQKIVQISVVSIFNIHSKLYKLIN